MWFRVYSSIFFFFSSRRRHTRLQGDWSSDVCSSDLMLLAEELEADWSKVRIESAPADKAYTNPMFGMQGTGGGTPARARHTPPRQAGAAARGIPPRAAAGTGGRGKAPFRPPPGAGHPTPPHPPHT